MTNPPILARRRRIARWRPTLQALMCLALISATVSAASADPRNLSASGLALSGYDPVEYVDHQLALKGFIDIEYRHEGARYRFRSQQNRDAFAANPDRYRPAYGGWCAYGLASNGEGEFPRGRYPPDPRLFQVMDGQLYLFYRERNHDGRELWNRDPPRYRQSADREWRRIMRSDG